MERIAIDMDEVMADTLGHQLTWLQQKRGVSLQKADLVGKKPHDRTADAHIAALEAAMHQGDFFAEIPVMTGAQTVIKALYGRYEVFVGTAAMDYPKSCHAKFDWLQRHFAFIHPERFVFCGDKSILRADFLIDDSPRHFRNFIGKGILFESPHNMQESGFERVRSWQEVAKRFL